MSIKTVHMIRSILRDILFVYRSGFFRIEGRGTRSPFETFSPIESLGPFNTFCQKSRVENKNRFQQIEKVIITRCHASLARATFLY